MNNFVNTIIEEVRKVYPEARNIEVQKVKKQNGIELHGLLIHQKDENMVPTIYLDYFFQDFKKGKSIKSIIDEISSIYEEHRYSKQVDVKSLYDLESIKDKIYLKVLNTSLNEKYLSDIPQRKIADLSLVALIRITTNSDENATIVIKYNLLNLIGINEEELFRLAFENSKKDLVFTSMLNVLKEFTSEDFKMEELTEEAFFPPIYIVTNKIKFYGAYHIGIEESLKYIAEKVNGDFYILPSSVHELLIVPVNEMINDEAELKQMIADVNNTQVADDELLSYNLYYFSKDFGLVIR